MNMETIASRFLKARKLREMSQEDVAECVGCGQTAINKIESGETKRSKFLNKIAKCLHVNLDWLEEGVGSMTFDNNVEPAKMGNYKEVPLISWVQAGDSHVALIDETETYPMIHTYETHSKNTYALRVNGDSMTAKYGDYTFPEGTIIIIDPEQGQDLTNGIFVIAKENGHDAVTFKQLKFDGATPYLNPLNPDYPKIFKEFRVIGKVIDARFKKLP